MLKFSLMWSDALGVAVRAACPEKGYTASLVGDDIGFVMDAVNQGIDAYLEACYVPARGDRFRMEIPEGVRGRISGPRLECLVSPESLPVLVRRLLEMNRNTDGSGDDDDGPAMLASSICDTLDIELI